METTKKRGGAPLGNTNGQKGDVPARANLAMRCTPEMRAAVEASAARDGVTKSEWLVSAVNLALNHE